jgi:hypothetical protein
MPGSYPELLKKLAGFFFWETYISLFFLRVVPEIDAAFHRIETYGPFQAFADTIPHYDKLNPTGFIIALIAAVVAFETKLHDRLSDWFGIRQRFDVGNILLPLAVLVGAKLTPMQLSKLVSNRKSLMHMVFYRFADSISTNSLVRKHDINQALAAWSWYWIFIENLPLFLSCAVVAYYFAAYKTSCAFSGIFVLCLLVATFRRKKLADYTRPEIESIVNDPDASAAVKAAFDAL